MSQAGRETLRRGSASSCARAPVLRRSRLDSCCFSPTSSATKSDGRATGFGGVSRPDSNHGNPGPGTLGSSLAPLRGARSREQTPRLKPAQTQASPLPRKSVCSAAPGRGAASQRSQCGFAPSGREPARRHDNRPRGARPGPTPPGVRTRPDPPLPSPVAAHTPPPCRLWEGAGPAA